MAQQYALRWPITGGVQILNTPAGFDPWPQAISNDGSVVVGWVNNQTTGDPSPARWDGTSWTPLAASTDILYAPNISQDSTYKVLGVGGGTSGNGADGIVWTTPSTIVHYAPLSPRPRQWFSGGFSQRATSDDFSVINGMSADPSSTTPPVAYVRWTGGSTTPTAIETLIFPYGGSPGCCSQDGSFVLDVAGLAGSTHEATGYWKNGTFYRLTIPSPYWQNETERCDGAGTIAYGYVVDPATGNEWPCYWDSLTTITGTMTDSDGTTTHNTYGTPHLMQTIADATVSMRRYGAARWCSETGNVSVGTSADASFANHAVRWNGTTITDLGIGVALGCTPDGSIATGYTTDAVYWDATNEMHVLPYPPGFWYSGQAFGISRDGSMIYGIAYGDPPAAPASLAMDNVLAVDETPATVAGSQIFLDWSDDRGHSFGSPVGQPIGATGAYLTSVQWQRLGMARDRVFRLTFSVPVATAIQGAWIEVNTSAKS